jgi:hypothetical protein
MVMPVLLEALESDINVDRLTGVETLRELGKISRDRDRQP